MRENLNNFSSKLTIALALFMSHLGYAQDNLLAQNDCEKKIEQLRIDMLNVMQHEFDGNKKYDLMSLSKRIEDTKNLLAQNDCGEKIEQLRIDLLNLVQHDFDEKIKHDLIKLSKGIEYTKDISAEVRKNLIDKLSEMLIEVSDQGVKKYIEDILNDLQFEDQRVDIYSTEEDDDDAVYFAQMSDGDFKNIGKISSLNLEELEKLVEYIEQYNKKGIALNPDIKLESRKVEKLLRRKYKNIIHLEK